MYNKKKYKLVNLDNGDVITLDGEGNNVELVNWQDSEFTYKRSTKTLTEARNYSKNIEFVKNGAKFIRDAFLIRNVEARVQMFEIRFNPITAIPYNYYIGQFDFSTYISEKTKVKISLDSGGLERILKSKSNTKFELNRNTDINGNTITDLRLNRFEVINRPIPLNSLLETSSEDSSSSIFRMRYGDARRLSYYSLPFLLTYESDDNISAVPNDVLTTTGITKDLTGLLTFEPLQSNRIQLFYYNNNRDRELNITFDLNFYATFRRNNNLEERFGSLALVKFTGGDDPFFLPEPRTLSTISDIRGLDEFTELVQLQSLVDGTSQQVTYNNTLNIELKEGESLGLFFVGGGEFDVFSGASVLDIDFTDINSSIKINELSTFNNIPRLSRFIFNRDAGSRLSEILTGSNVYKSNFFNNSDFKDTGLTSGKILRGFSDGKIITSWRDFVNNAKTVFNVGYNIEFNKGKEVIRHEHISYFLRREVKIKIPSQVSNVSRSVANDVVFATAELGYNKPNGDNLYEEVQGLNEYNTINEYSLPITVTDSSYRQVSPYRSDGEGKELTVRQHEKFNPTGDYRTDNDIFNLDLKQGANSIYWQERDYLDNNMALPENVFSPETATGLRFTPLNILKRHAQVLVSSLTKFKDKYIRFASSIGNSDLITENEGEQPQSQRYDLPINSIENPIFVNEYISFEYPLDFDLLNQVNGYTLINGEEVPNTYFKVEFVNEFNEKEYGYLFDLKPNKQGKWKLLKAF